MFLKKWVRIGKVGVSTLAMDINFRNWLRRNGMLTIGLVVCLAVTVLVGSFVFDPPDHLQGIVIEKIYVPSKVKVGDTPYGGVRRGRYSIRVVQEEQWIAVVRTAEGDTLTVHCQPDHYGARNIGDPIRFREYKGSLLHIRYFAHGEEEGSD